LFRFTQLAAFLACTWASGALAQTYPSQPFRIIVPTGTGTTLDAIARIIGGELQRTWGKPVTVENRPGENNNAGTRYAAMAPADGHTLLMVGAGFAANPILGENAGYDPMLNFVPVSQLVSLPTVAIVNPIFPAQNIKTLVEVLNLSPGQFSYASAGYGSSLHLAAEAFAHATKIQVLHVPFKNSKQAEGAIISGDVQMLLAPMPSAMPLIEAGRVRALAIAAPERHQALIDVPTMTQAGVENYDFSSWVGVVVPANTPQAIVQKLSDHLGKIMRQPKLKQRLATQYVDIVGSTPEQFLAVIQKDQARWTAIAQQSKNAATKLEQSLQPQSETVESTGEIKTAAPPKPEQPTSKPAANKAPMPPKSGSAAIPADTPKSAPDAMDADSMDGGAEAKPEVAPKPAPAPSKPASKKTTTTPKGSTTTPPPSAAKSAPAASDTPAIDSNAETKSAASPKPEPTTTKPTPAKPTTAQPASAAAAAAKTATPAKTGTSTPSTTVPKISPEPADAPREVLPGKPAQ
jgi:tripartite-type tricarboxylate transporter receptor subunit TctC